MKMRKKDKGSFERYLIIAFILEFIYLLIFNLITPVNISTFNFLNYHLFIISFILAGFCFYSYLIKKNKRPLFYLVILIVLGVILDLVMIFRYAGSLAYIFIMNLFLAGIYFFVAGIILYLVTWLAVFILDKIER